jgi:hypothetical protein
MNTRMHKIVKNNQKAKRAMSICGPSAYDFYTPNTHTRYKNNKKKMRKNTNCCK